MKGANVSPMAKMNLLSEAWTTPIEMIAQKIRPVICPTHAMGIGPQRHIGIPIPVLSVSNPKRPVPLTMFEPNGLPLLMSM